LKIRNAIIFLTFVPVLLAQKPETATVRGILVRWGTEEPVGQATLELRSLAGAATSVAITSSQNNGQFEFPNIPLGNYRLIAFADGFAPTEFGQQRQNGSGRSLTVVSGTGNNFRIGIVRGGTIAGKVTNQNGQPMVYSNVDILKGAYDATGQLTPVVALTVTTNDLGEYRAFWLAPGQYILRAGYSQLNSYSYQGTINPLGTDTTRVTPLVFQDSPPRANAAPATASQEPAITPVLSNYYGGAADPKNAQLVEVRSGTETAGIDIRILPIQFSRRVRLTGTVIGPPGGPSPDSFGLSISTWPEGQSTPLSSVRAITTRIPATNPNLAPGAMRYVLDGKFDGSVSEGFYQIRATQDPYSGRVVFEAGNQDVNLTIPLHSPSSVSGRLQIEGGTSSAVDLTKLQVGIRTLPSSAFSSPVAADGQFRIEGVIDGDYQVYVLPSGPLPLSSGIESVFVKSVRVNNADTMSSSLRIEGSQAISGMEITLGSLGASINGRVVNGRQEAVDRATMVLLPQGSPPFREDRYRTVTTDKSGQFQFRGLPPGEYRVLAWEDVDPGAWFNPVFLSAYERYTTTIMLQEGKNQTMEVTAIPAGTP
jgi:protocatechuate 3,4-dioxygenase beta subunit